MLRFCSVISGSNPRERIEALYECLAPLYSLLHPFVRTVAVRAANLLNDGTGQNALDVCTGTGVVADALVKRGYDVTGIDLASAMLMQRRQMRKTMGIKNARMDARRLAFPDRSFDVCAISMGLHEFSPADRGRILGEMIRVSKRHILVADYSGTQPLIVRLAEWLEASHFRDFTDGSLGDQLTGAGLKIIRQDRWLSMGLYLCAIPEVPPDDAEAGSLLDRPHPPDLHRTEGSTF